MTRVGRTLTRARAALICPLIVGLGCVTPSHSATAAASSACAFVASGAAPAESISVVAPVVVDAAQAPVPANPVERFVFAQVYETLIDVDCAGHAYPGLARSWSLDRTNTRVTLALRDGARFWTGEPVTARDVVTAWRATGRMPTDAGQLARRPADATTIVDDRTLIVSLPDTESLVLAEPALAVYRPAVGAAWPVGSGGYRVEPSAGTLALVPVAPGATPRVVIRPGRSADARDAIDAGVDVLLTADPAAVRYAATRATLTAIALPWDRAYALALPSRSANVVADLSVSGDSAAAFRASLARDAVRAEARPAEPTGEWSGVSACGLSISHDTPPPATAGPPSRRIVYRDEDHVAREIAARVVALEPRVTAVSLAPSDYVRALRTGHEFAYVVSVSRPSLVHCHDLASLIASAPWLAGPGGGIAPERFIPLIETRERAIVNRERVSVSVDWDGTLRMVPSPARP